MKQRILQVRKNSGLKQDEFAKRLGLTKSAISGYETGRRIPTEQVIKSICREFFIEETWLRTGKGKMTQCEPANSLEQVIYDYGCTDFEAAFLRSYFNLNSEERKNLSNYLFEVFGIALRGLKKEDSDTAPLEEE